MPEKNTVKNSTYF